MRRFISILFALVLVLSFSLVTGVPAMADPGTIEVSQPIQVTSNSYYERGESIVYDGINYWMFYGRSAGCTDTYATGDPDVNDYVVYYKKATTVAGLASATAADISGVSRNSNGYLGETGAAYFGGEVWAFATIDVGANADLYGWWTSDGGTTWNEVGPIISGLSDGQGHHDEVTFNGELWVVEGSGNFTTIHSATPKTGGWSTPLDVDAALTGGLVHFFVDDLDLYLAINASGMNYIYKYDSINVKWDKVDKNAPPNKYDPTLFKVGSDYVFAQAPWDGTKQYILQWSGSTLDDTFFNITSKMVTGGAYGSNPWVDMWPIGFTDNGGDSYLFFTSERNPSDVTSEIAGNIWYLPVDWTLSNDHYTYIQPAINAANPYDTINVAAGTYNPTSTIIINKDNLVLQGPQANVDPRPSYGSTRTAGSPSEAVIDGSASGLGMIICIDADNVVINGLEVKSGTGDMIKQNEAHSGTTVKYCIIHDGRGDEGVQLKKCTGGVLEYNYVFEIADKGDGLNIADTSSYGVIRYNEVAGIHGENAAIYIYDAEHMEIIGNLVRDSGFGGNDGIKVGAKGGSDAALRDVLIKDNIIHGITQDGISVYMSGVTVEGNEIYNCGSENGAIYLAFGIADITIRNNSVHDNELSTSKRLTSAGILIEERVDAATVTINFNNIYNNTPYGLTNEAAALLDATNNWWGNASGPTHTPNPGGTGDAVSDNVDYDPWLSEQYASTKSTGTATGTGTASFSPDSGAIEGQTSVAESTLPTAGKPGLVFQHGFFSFNIVGLTLGQTVVVTITLPSPAPVGTKYWKYHASEGGWIQIPMGDDDGDNVVTITLVDGGLGDDDGIANGTIVDQGGPGTPPPSPAPSPGVNGGGAAVFSPATSNLTITPAEGAIAEVRIGEIVTITAEVTNKGDAPGSYTVTLKINGVVEEEKTVTLTAHEKKTVTFTVIKEEAGTYKIEVNGLKGEFIVPELPAATFEVTTLSISPAKVKAGETVTISVLVTETSGGSGSYDVTLKINDEVVATEEVTLDANASQTVTFTIANQEAGSYKVEVNGLVSEFIVEVPPPEAPSPPAPAPPAESPINWAMLWYIVGGVVVVGLIIFFLIRRRAY